LQKESKDTKRILTGKKWSACPFGVENSNVPFLFVLSIEVRLQTSWDLDF